MDDAPLFRHVYASNPIADSGRVAQMWSREFIAMHRENVCFVLTCHPFISGRAPRVTLIEDLVRYARRQSGVCQKTMSNRPRVPPAPILRWASAACSGGNVSATRNASRFSATRRPRRSSAS